MYKIGRETYIGGNHWCFHQDFLLECTLEEAIQIRNHNYPEKSWDSYGQFREHRHALYSAEKEPPQ